jgi:hypothetical protein
VSQGKGTKVTSIDLDTGEGEASTIKDDFVIVCDGDCHISSMNVHRNGTVQLVIKRPPDNSGRYAIHEGFIGPSDVE